MGYAKLSSATAPASRAIVSQGATYNIYGGENQLFGEMLIWTC